MARALNRLTSKRVEKLLRNGTAGYYPDGAGLYLVIVNKANANWLRRYQPPGAAPHVTAGGKVGYRTRYLGLGSARVFGLAEARERNRKISQMLADGIDPLTQKRAQRAAQAAEAAKTRTFGQCALDYHRAHAAGWRSQKHAQQWATSMLGTTPSGRPVRDDVIKPLRPMPVASITTPMIMAVLQPRWSEKTVTMSRLRERIESVIDAAVAAGYRPAGPNPASWSILKHLLAKPAKAKHFDAMPFADVPAFMAELRQREGSAARALEFAIMCSSRTNEVLGARWREVDWDAKLWTVPGGPDGRMKGGEEHRVPLSPQAVALLRDLPREGDDGGVGTGNDLVFLSSQHGQQLAPNSLLRLLRAMGHTKITPHGFRSSFSDWAHEQPGAVPMVIEMCLAHAVGDEVAKAYRRGDLLQKRRKLMDAWARHCASPMAGNVVPMRRPAAQS
jgi:integrase